MGRNGVTPEAAEKVLRRSNTLIATMMVKMGDADAMLCGLVGRFDRHLAHLDRRFQAASPMPSAWPPSMPCCWKGAPCSSQTPTSTKTPAPKSWPTSPGWRPKKSQRFGIPPKVAFCSHSNYGSSTRKSALKVRQARDLFCAQHPHIECDGEIARRCRFGRKRARARLAGVVLHGEANILICPNLDAANILFECAQNHRLPRHHHWPRADGRGRLGPHHHAIVHGAPHRQYDCPGGRQSPANRLNQPVPAAQASGFPPFSLCKMALLVKRGKAVAGTPCLNTLVQAVPKCLARHAIGWVGRAVECTSLENWRGCKSFQGFESLTHRQNTF